MLLLLWCSKASRWEGGCLWTQFVMYISPEKGHATSWKGPQGRATREAEGAVRKTWVRILWGSQLSHADAPHRVLSYQAPGICFLSLSLTFFLGGEDPVSDLPAGPFPVLKPSLRLSSPLAPEPPSVGAEPGRRVRGSPMCSVPCYSRLLPTRHT